MKKLKPPLSCCFCQYVWDPKGFAPPQPPGTQVPVTSSCWIPITSPQGQTCRGSTIQKHGDLPQGSAFQTTGPGLIRLMSGSITSPSLSCQLNPQASLPPGCRGFEPLRCTGIDMSKCRGQLKENGTGCMERKEGEARADKKALVLGAGGGCARSWRWSLCPEGRGGERWEGLADPQRPGSKTWSLGRPLLLIYALKMASPSRALVSLPVIWEDRIASLSS